MADVPLMSNPMTTQGDIVTGGASGASGRLAIGTAAQVLTVNAGATAPEWAAATGGSGISSGTSNPGSPSAGDLFWRTDLGLMIYYDGTRWLSTTLYHLPFSGSDRALSTVTATTNNYSSATMWAGDDVYLVDYIAQINVATTNDGTRYWNWLLQKLETTGTTGTTIVTPDSSALSTGWSNVRTAINAAHTDIGTLRANVNKISSPGAFLGFFAVTYRLVVA